MIIVNVKRIEGVGINIFIRKLGQLKRKAVCGKRKDILNGFFSGWLPARLMVAKDGGSAGDGNSLLQVFAQIHPDSSFEKNWPWVKFWKPPDFNQDQFGHFKQNLPWVKVWNHLWNPWPLSASFSHSYSNILIDIACAVPIALLLSHSYSHSHSSFQVHFLIQYFLLIFPNFQFLNPIPLFRFMQRPGELVWVNTGCVHWVQVGSSSSSWPSWSS